MSMIFHYIYFFECAAGATAGHALIVFTDFTILPEGEEDVA